MKMNSNMTGKEKCEFLRTIRINMASKNGIPYTPKECTHEGDCLGTCPLCEYETKVLMKKIEEKLGNEGTIVIDSDSINKLEHLNDEQEQKQPEEDDSKVVDIYPKDNDKHYFYPRLMGDVCDEDEYLYVEPKSTSAWHEIKEIAKLLSMFPKAIYKYLTTKAKCVKIKYK